MNFTTCEKDCDYQQEGYCVITEYNNITVISDCDCIYFKPKSKDDQISTQNKLFEDYKF